jgi:hypothetical protein
MMDEAKWLIQRHDPEEMLLSLRDLTNITRTKAGKRRSRLFLIACCRLDWELLDDPRLCEIVEIGEAFAQSAIDKAVFRKARRTAEIIVNATSSWGPPAEEFRRRRAFQIVVQVMRENAFVAALYTSTLSFTLADGTQPADAERYALFCDLIRDIFGNPFRPLTIARLCSAGTTAPFVSWRNRPTTNASCPPARWSRPASVCSPMPWRTPAAKTRPCSNICVHRDRIRAAVTSLMRCGA